MPEVVLGIHYGHDATAVLLLDGEIIEAMSEERLSRQKKHIGYPHLAVAYIKKKYNIETIPHVVVVGEEFGDFAFHTTEDNKRFRSRAPGDWFGQAVGVRYPLLGTLYRYKSIAGFLGGMIGAEEKTKSFMAAQFPAAKIEYIHHHLAHAWAALPFMEDTNRRLIITLDGQGDDASGSINLFENGDITVLHRFKREHSIGSLYSSVVELLGMSRNEHEFKVMGLAPYAKKSSGEKVYQELKKLVWFDEGTMTLQSLFDTRNATSYLIANNFFQYRFDSLACGIQKLTEELVKDIVRASIRRYSCTDIAVGGGVFMNVKANQYVHDMEEVSSMVIIPSCGDESLAIGAAVYGYKKLLSHKESGPHLTDLYLGSSYTDQEIKLALESYAFIGSCEVTYCDPLSDPIEKKVADLLSRNSVVGRFKGRSEWGARALGNRSILANPSSRENVKLINEMIKGRDFWMPFATSMKYERRHDYLALTHDTYAPFMAITFNTTSLAEQELIAALHPYDLTSRPQMVRQEVNRDYHTLISEYEKITGSGGILNTSFNLHGEPNVETPEDALRTFVHSGLPHLAIGNYLVSKRPL